MIKGQLIDYVGLPNTQEASPITIKCDELKCDQFQINFEEYQDNAYDIKTENELQLKIEGIVQERVKGIMDEIMGRVQTDIDME